MRRVMARGGAVHVEEVPAPATPVNGYLVEAICSLISPGTEMAIIAGTSKQADGAQTLGYSLVGRVIQAGPQAPPVRAGTVVACAGFEYSPHAEIAAVPRLMATPVPDGVDQQAAAFTTLGAVAIHALRQGRVSLGDRVVVIGLGVVGQLLAQVARAAGARVAGLDVLHSRAELARRLGTELALDPHKVDAPGEGDAAGEVARWTGGLGADVVFLCTSGGEGVLDLAARLARNRGRIVIVGTPVIAMQRDLLFARELEITIARAYGPGRYDPVYEIEGIDYPPGFVRWTQERNRAEFLRLLAAGLLRVTPLITHTFRLDEAPAAYAALRDDPASTMGVILTFDAPTT